MLAFKTHVINRPDTDNKMNNDHISEVFIEIIFYFYCINIVVAILSYLPQQIILIDMIKGKRPAGNDISALQFWVWTIANLVSTCYVIMVVENDLPLIILSSVNFLHCLISASLNSYVHHLHKNSLVRNPLTKESTSGEPTSGKEYNHD